MNALRDSDISQFKTEIFFQKLYISDMSLDTVLSSLQDNNLRNYKYYLVK